jgi:hypothetical protein
MLHKQVPAAVGPGMPQTHRLKGLGFADDPRLVALLGAVAELLSGIPRNQFLI